MRSIAILAAAVLALAAPAATLAASHGGIAAAPPAEASLPKPPTLAESRLIRAAGEGSHAKPHPDTPVRFRGR